MFRNHRDWSCYADFVEFLLCSGMRIGEVIALRWENISGDYQQVWISQCRTKGQTRPVKSHKDRTIKLPNKLTEIFVNRRVNKSPSEYVFLSPNGRSPIDGGIIRKRAWYGVLKELNIDYRKPYTTRKTYISHTLAKGANPVALAKMTGHDTRVTFSSYVGCYRESKFTRGLLG